MHIMEGFLPAGHALAWTVVSAPFVVRGVCAINRVMREHPRTKLLLAACGAFVFVLSALKLPSLTGSSSHPTGVGLGSVLFGPSAMTGLGTLALLFQALLLAHGGLTTLGANVFAMAVVGPFVAFGVFRVARRARASLAVAAFLGAALGDLATYVITAAQLALAFPDPASGVSGSFVKFATIFALTQIPLAVVEGLLTALVINLLLGHSRDELAELALINETPR